MQKFDYGIQFFGTNLDQKLIDEKIKILKSGIGNLIFYLVIAGTDTSQIQGISSAGTNAIARKRTALADAEFLLYGPSTDHKYKLPFL